jgi:tetratricopeptide (TPR) repeat protein
MDEVLSQNNSLNKKGFLEKVSFWFMIVLVFLLPLFFMPVSFTPVQFGTSLLFASLVIVSAIIFVISKLKSGQISIPASKIHFLALFFPVPLVYVLSFLTHGASRIAFLGYTFDITTVGFILLGFIFMFLVSIIFNSKERIFYAFVTSVISSIVVALFVISRFVFGPGFLSFGIFGSITDTVIGSFNNIGIFFAISVILSFISLEMLNLTKFMRILLHIALGLSLFFIAVVNFKVLWIVLGIISLIFTGYNFYTNKTKSGQVSVKHLSKYSVAVLVLSLLFIVFHTGLGTFISTKLKIFTVDVRPNVSVTYNIAKQTLKDSYILGSGPNSFVFQWLSYKPSDVNPSIFWNTDFSYGVGLIPTLIITTGFLGLISWILFFLAYIYLGFKAIFDKNVESFDFYILLSSFIVSIFLWIMAIVYVPSIVIFVLTLFFTGLFLAQNYITSPSLIKTVVFENDPKKGFVSSLILVSSVVALFGLGLSLYVNQISLWNFQKALISANKGDVVGATNFIDSAIRRVPYDVYYRTKADITSIDIQRILATAVTKDNQEQLRNDFANRLSSTLQSVIKARDVNPTNYLNWVALGKVYSVAVPPATRIQGAYEEAVNSYNEALKRNPNNPAIHLLFAQLEIAKGDALKAKDYINMAISKKNNYIDAYYLLSQIQTAEGNIKEAINSVSLAAVIEPSNPLLFFQLGVLKYNAGDFKGAIDALSQSIILAPDYANAKYFIGMSYAQLRNNEKALIAFKDILKTNPDNTDLKNIINTLESGRSIFASPTVEKVDKNKLPVKEKDR